MQLLAGCTVREHDGFVRLTPALKACGIAGERRRQSRLLIEFDALFKIRDFERERPST